MVAVLQDTVNKSWNVLSKKTDGIGPARFGMSACWFHGAEMAMGLGGDLSFRVPFRPQNITCVITL